MLAPPCLALAVLIGRLLVNLEDRGPLPVARARPLTGTGRLRTRMPA